MKKLVKLSGKDVKAMVEQIIEESKKTKKPTVTKEAPKTTKKPVMETRRAKKPSRIIRLTEAEMIEFLDKLATRVENSRRRRSLK